MKKLFVLVSLIVILMSLVACSPSYLNASTTPNPDLKWREFTVTLDSGKTLTFCAFHAKVNIGFLNNIQSVEFYDDDYNVFGVVNKPIKGVSYDPTFECK
jgi:hypothetical protein